MLLIGLTSFLIAIPLYSSTITPTLLTRITSIILLFSAAISFNSLYVQAIGSGLGLYSGLFHVTTVTQFMEMFLYVIGACILLGYANEASYNQFFPQQSWGIGASRSHPDWACPDDLRSSAKGESKGQMMDIISSTAFPIPASWDWEEAGVPLSQRYVGKLSLSNQGASFNETDYPLSPSLSAVPSIAEYPLIILFTTIGASFLISSGDLVSMYLSIELQSFAVYILAAIYRNSESATSAGLKYFLLGALSSALILLGSSLIYAYTGLTHFEGIYMISNCNGYVASTPQALLGEGVNSFPNFFPAELGTGNHEDISQGIVLGVLIIGVGFLFKVAAAPFHNWAPDVYDGVPTIVTTWLTVMPKISIFLFLLELQLSIGDANGPLLGMMMEYQQESFNLWRNLLLTTSLLSLVIGTVVGLAQYRLKRLLAFSTISHVGFLLLALSVNSEESITSFLFYLMQYSITNLDAFLVVLAFGYLSVTGVPSDLDRKGKDISFISQLKGQFHANPILGLSLAICLFSMAGIPPLVGFFAKYMVLYSAIENGYYFLSFVGILASVISAAYYLRIIRVIHFDVAGDRRSPAPDNSPYPAGIDRTGGPRGENSKVNYNQVLTSAHSYVIAVLTLFILLFLISPSLWLNSSNLLALSLFTA